MLVRDRASRPRERFMRRDRMGTPPLAPLSLDFRVVTRIGPSVC